MSPADALADLARRLDARAAGLWSLAGDRLVQVAFAGPGLAPDVAEGFRSATRSVPLDRPELGIVAAVIAGRPAVSRAVDLPPDAGSGFWLRAFGAERSVAVPIRDATGAIRGVASVALAEDSGREDEEVVRALGEIGLGREHENE